MVIEINRRVLGAKRAIGIAVVGKDIAMLFAR